MKAKNASYTAFKSRTVWRENRLENSDENESGKLAR